MTFQSETHLTEREENSLMVLFVTILYYNLLDMGSHVEKVSELASMTPEHVTLYRTLLM